jgi:hypothetical protein
MPATNAAATVMANAIMMGSTRRSNNANSYIGVGNCLARRRSPATSARPTPTSRQGGGRRSSPGRRVLRRVARDGTEAAGPAPELVSTLARCPAALDQLSGRRAATASRVRGSSRLGGTAPPERPVE